MSSKVDIEQGEIDLTPTFIQCMNQMCLNSDYSDVSFIVEGTKLSAHKNILAMRSSYFRALLYGGLAESAQNEIELKVPLEAFKSILKYLYTGRMSLAKMCYEEILDYLRLIDEYGFEELKLGISTYLGNTLSLENCFAIFEAARMFDLKALTDVSMTFIETNLKDLLGSNTFQTLSQDSLCTLLVRDPFYAPELQIFNAVCNWYTVNPQADIEKIISLVRLPLISLNDLLGIVRSSEIVDPNILLDAIKEQTTSDNLRYRIRADVNIATAEYNSKTIHGKIPSALLDGNTTNHNGSSGYTYSYHNIEDEKGIVVEFGENSVINHLRILLWDLDPREYKYYIEVSVDQKKWKRIIDRTKNGHRSWQNLYFPSQLVRYIKLVGTHCTVGSNFYVVALEAYFASKTPIEVNENI